MITQEKLQLWRAAEEQAVSDREHPEQTPGVAFGKLPWNYRQKVLDFLKPHSELLDLHTGKGTFLLSLRHPFAQTGVTEGCRWNVELCRKKLAPLGIAVQQQMPGEPIPYEDNRFDVVLCYQGHYDIQEVRRVLKPGGYFLTQQIGGESEAWLRQQITGCPVHSDFNLENQVQAFEKNGFTLNFKDQCFVTDRYPDMCALIGHMKTMPPEYPAFSVETHMAALEKLDALCDRLGYIPCTAQRFMIIARKKREP